MRTAFAHNNGNKEFYRGTIALSVPDKQLLLSINNKIADGTVLLVGFSLCSEKDQFNKAKGRLIASNRMEPHKCYLDFIENKEGKQVYHFNTTLPNILSNNPSNVSIDFGVSITENSNYVKLLYACFTV